MRNSATTSESGCNKLRVFLSYAREDHADVIPIYSRLRDTGFVPWMDTEGLRPGVRWERAITAAIKQSDVFLAILSKHSVNKRGVVQKEVRIALDVQMQKLDGDVYIIPVRIGPCQIPASLDEFQSADIFEREGWRKLEDSLRLQHAALFGMATAQAMVGTLPERVIGESRQTYFTLPGVLPYEQGNCKPAVLGISSSELAVLAQHGLRNSITEFFALVQGAVSAPVSVFRGLRRPFSEASKESVEAILVYVSKPPQVFQWSELAPEGLVIRPTPPNMLFTVLLSLNPVNDPPAYFEGTIERWSWVMEDSVLKGAPSGWQERYAKLLWRKDS